MTNSIDFSKKILAVVTGASKGIGRRIAIDISSKLNDNSTVVLLARSQTGLEETKNLIKEVNSSILVSTHSIDLSKADLKTYQEVFANIPVKEIQVGVIFHNAGSTGEVKQTTDLADLKIWRDYFDLNLFSVSILNSVFIHIIQPLAQQVFVVNITSLCGRLPYKNLAMYGSGKAARELFFKVLAVEEPNITVLNYSPGPVDTEMFEGIIENAQSDEVRDSFKTVKNTSILTPQQTVGKLMEILGKGDFKSGDTIDYFDRI